MNPISIMFRGDEESSSTRNEDHSTSALRSRREAEEDRCRREWQRQRERRQHEKLKEQKILEYERKRAQALKAEEQSSLQGRRSESPIIVKRDELPSSVAKSANLHEELDRPTSDIISFKKDLQNGQFFVEIRRIMCKNIPIQESIPKLQRDITNPEDVIIKRRKGEGCKPIFDRDEIKNIKSNEIEKQCIIATIDEKHLVLTNKSETSRKDSSLSPIRSHLYSGHLFDCQSRHHTDLECWDSKTKNHDACKNNRRCSIEKCRKCEEKYIEKDASKHDINRSRSRESRSSHSRSFMEEKSYRDRYRERSNERKDRDRNRDRERDKDKDRDKDRNKEREREKDRSRDRSRERRNVAPYYIESPIPVPIYYNSFPPRPIIVSPMIPLRGQIPSMGRGRHPTLMAPIRPFPPRFVPPDMYRLGYVHHQINQQNIINRNIINPNTIINPNVIINPNTINRNINPNTIINPNAIINPNTINRNIIQI